MTVGETEDARIDQVLEKYAPTAADIETLFLDEEAGRRQIHLQAGSERDRAERTVRREGDVVRLGHRGDRDAGGRGDAAQVTGELGQDRLVPAARVAAAAAQALTELTQGQDVPAGEMFFQPELVLRESTAPPRTRD